MGWFISTPKDQCIVATLPKLSKQKSIQSFLEGIADLVILPTAEQTACSVD